MGDFIYEEELDGTEVLECIKTAQIKRKSGWILGEVTQTESSAF